MPMSISQGRQQKNFQRGVITEKRPKNSTIMPLFTIPVSCMKIKGGPAPLLPTPMQLV